MESKETNLPVVDQQVRLYCGECNTECDYMGVSPNKILAFVCLKCYTFNEVEDDTEEDRRWLYATNNYATISADIVDGLLRRPAPIAQRHTGKPIEQFAKDWGAKRLYIYKRTEE